MYGLQRYQKEIIEWDEIKMLNNDTYRIAKIFREPSHPNSIIDIVVDLVAISEATKNPLRKLEDSYVLEKEDLKNVKEVNGKKVYGMNTYGYYYSKEKRKERLKTEGVQR